MPGAIFDPTSQSNWNICTAPPFHVLQPVPAAASPVQLGGSLLVGEWSPNHTSTVGIIYKDTTIPTPWPILLAGLLWSLASTLINIFTGPCSNANSSQPKPSHALAIILSVNSIYQSIRSIFAFIAVCQALAGAGGRFLPASAVMALMLSTFPNIVNVKTYRFSRILAVISTVCNVITLSITVIMDIFLRHKDIYGKWFLVGGTCPKVIGLSDVKQSCPYQYFVGCGIDHLVQTGIANSTVRSGYFEAQDLNSFQDKNALWIGEIILGFTIGFSLLLVLIPVTSLVIFASPLALWLLGKPFKIDNNKDWVEAVWAFEIFALIILIPVSVVSFPINYVTETRSVSFVVQDSVGNLSSAVIQLGNEAFNTGQSLWQTWTGDGVNQSTWTDFFLIQVPHDHFGFLKFWWNIHGGTRVWQWLSLL